MRRLLAIGILGAALWAQAPPHGRELPEGEADAEAGNPNEILWKWLNFAILAGGLGYLANKNLGPYFRTRSEEIRKGIAEAGAMKADAEARAAAIEQRVTNLAGEVENIRHEMRAEMARESERLQEETRQQMARIHAQAETEIAQASRLARLDLKKHAAELAIDLAEQQIRQRMTPELSAELVRRFAADVARKGSVN